MSTCFTYLDLIAKHLKEHHAAILVGAGFSRNADKPDDSFPDSPTWPQLAEAFVNKLSSDAAERERLLRVSPLVLAERVEAVFGRPELDHLLLEQIPDQGYRPSSLHRKLLKLPWSDIFTTNYDTLLERAGDDMTEESFSVITTKDDLIGSSGTARIVKLHGSFPSQRPFIITSEDYRTYPQIFAPFVNTVQQALLENTLCLIGFSGDDPNFEKWIGWIRDNLGSDNSPNIYLLTHQDPSEAEKKLLYRRKIIPVDISSCAPGQPVRLQYEAALDYLLKKQEENDPSAWPELHILPSERPIAEIAELLRKVRASYPGWLTVPKHRRDALLHLRRSAESYLNQCGNSEQPLAGELDFLLEYDWLREQCLRPPFKSELQCYDKILERSCGTEEELRCLPVRFSMLRDLRESGLWEDWETLHAKLSGMRQNFSSENHHRMVFEECMYALFRYRIAEVKRCLKHWDAAEQVPQWALRRAGLLAECGEVKEARELLRNTILAVRKRIKEKKMPDLALLSLESALMSLQKYVSQADESDWYRSGEEPEIPEGKESRDSERKELEKRRREEHYRYRISWEDNEAFYANKMENVWVPYTVKTSSPSFDFGKRTSTVSMREDTELMDAFAFLRFREETGHPFRIYNVNGGNRAACGAAERLAAVAPDWSILTLARANQEKGVQDVLTRPLLSSWTAAEVDQRAEFYMEAVRMCLEDVQAEDWFAARGFSGFAAPVLMETLSRLCCKCSKPVLWKLFELAKQIYESEKRDCFSNGAILMERLLRSFSTEEKVRMLPELVNLPMLPKEEERRRFQDPLEMVKLPETFASCEENQELNLESSLFPAAEDEKREENGIARRRLMYCWAWGFLSERQIKRVSSFLWKNGSCQVPAGWNRTICLRLPLPPETEGGEENTRIEVKEALRKTLKEEVLGYCGKGRRTQNDWALLHELSSAAISDVFLPQDMSELLEGFESRVLSLRANLNRDNDWFSLGDSSRSLLYASAETMLQLTLFVKDWIPSGEDGERMNRILEGFRESGIHNCGLQVFWSQWLPCALREEEELQKSFLSHDSSQRHAGYNALILSAKYPEQHLFSEQGMQYATDLLIQQLMWSERSSMENALNTVERMIRYRKELFSETAKSQLLYSLSGIRMRTEITREDSVAEAEEKGEIRIAAAGLADTLLQNLWETAEVPEELRRWNAVMENPEEFAEVRRKRS